MKLRRLCRQTCPVTGGTWYRYVSFPTQQPSPAKLTKPERAFLRQLRRANTPLPVLLLYLLFHAPQATNAPA